MEAKDLVSALATNRLFYKISTPYRGYVGYWCLRAREDRFYCGPYLWKENPANIRAVLMDYMAEVYALQRVYPQVYHLGAQITDRVGVDTPNGAYM